jgi:ABC-type tungstate transport system permease subunit
MVFSNQALILGPPSDPGRIRGLGAAEAMRRIATSGAYFVSAVSDIRIDYLNELLLASAGLEKGDWYVPSHLVGTALLQQAAAGKAYTVWGDEYASLRPLSGHLVPLVTTDPVLQRAMVTIVVNPTKVSGVNSVGAHALQAYLTEASTQAKILAFREDGFATPTYWPAAPSSA